MPVKLIGASSLPCLLARHRYERTGLTDEVVYPLPIEELIDPLLVGTLFSCLLFGICLAQATHYLSRADWKRERIDCWTVCAVVALSTWLGITQLIYARRMFVEEFGTLKGVANVANNTCASVSST